MNIIKRIVEKIRKERRVENKKQQLEQERKEECINFIDFAPLRNRFESSKK